MIPKTYLCLDEHIPAKAAFPVVDAHNHLWAAWGNVDKVVQVMDQAGVAVYSDLTANLSLSWGDGGYAFTNEDIDSFLTRCVQRHPRRFYGFTTATFNQPITSPLFSDSGEFVDRTVAVLRDHVRRGLRGLKILKEFGLHYRDAVGHLLQVDDTRFAPIWDEAGKLGIPVLIHQSDPAGCFEPAGPDNEHSDTLTKYPAWSFADPKFPRKRELLERRNNLIQRHPRTTFLLPHVANFPENLAYVSALLDRCPNAFIDFSSRMDELGRQPYTAREFMIRHQDRIYFGTDMPASVEMYRCYFRFLETFDEYFIPPDYDGTFGRHRWRIYGLGLPPDVLKKIYYQNALKLIPGLREDMRGRGVQD